MLKALSLLQPWASLVVMGLKTIETRSWNTAYRGTLLIHASKGKSGAAVAGSPALKKHMGEFKALPFGAIIGEVRLKDVLRISGAEAGAELLDRLTLEERAFGDYTGRYAWLFVDAVIYDDPIPAKGALGLWEAG